MNIAKGITNHNVVICVSKASKAMTMQSLLKKFGCRVTVVENMYDALKVIQQEMPHVVISESVLSDGSAGSLYDRLSQHPMLSKTPIIVHVLKKTKAEIQALAGRKFAGFYLGEFNPSEFVKKFNEVLATHSQVSPYFRSAEQLSCKPELTVNVSATFMGVKGEQVVAKSSMEVDAAATLVCNPLDKQYGPAMLKLGSNFRQGEDVFNMFPINRIQGKGRMWLEKLPLFGAEPESQVKTILFFEPNEAKFSQFDEILSGYGLDLLHAKTLSMAAAMVKRDPEGVQCVYLSELTTGTSSASWKEAYEGLAENVKPPVIIGTSSLNAKSQGKVRYIKKPFGLGLLVEMLEAASESVTANEVSNAGDTGVSTRYQAPAKLVGIDETGGIIQSKFPLLKNSRMTFSSDFLTGLWGEEKEVLVTSSASLPDKPDIWQARFDSVGAGNSKTKYFEKVIEKIGSEDEGDSAA